MTELPLTCRLPSGFRHSADVKIFRGRRVGDGKNAESMLRAALPLSASNPVTASMTERLATALRKHRHHHPQTMRSHLPEEITDRRPKGRRLRISVLERARAVPERDDCAHRIRQVADGLQIQD